MTGVEENRSVLVVDDEETLRIIIGSVLEDDGYEVTTAATGEEALEKFKANPFKLVISDIIMPGMSGMNLLKEIKEISPETEVVIMTSQASVETAINAVGGGAYDYLVKPFDELELISGVVNQAFEKIRLSEEDKNLVGELKEKNIELADAIDNLSELANRDGLTGLHNYRFFHEYLASEIVRSERYKREFSLLFIDIDNFKNYNDKLGHPSGDELLRTLSVIVKKFLRKSDFFARYGGEEFTVILPEMSKDNAIKVANSIREIVAKHHFPGGEKQPGGKLTVSVGLAAYPDDGKTGEELLDKADQALYRSKHTGRNRVCVYGVDV